MCLAVILAQTFEHKLRNTRWTRHESRCFFRCILCFWSVLSNIQCCANQRPVLLCFLFIKTVGTVTQTFTHRFRQGATVTFHFVCSSCFLPLKPNTSAIASVCFGSCVQDSAFHPTSVQEFHRCQKTRADVFTNFHLELNTSRTNCSRSSALSSGMPKMKSSLQCTPSASSIEPQYKHGTTALLC